jgi:hypothetical protein
MDLTTLPTDAAAYLAAYPMAPLSGLFLIIVGLCIVLGAARMRWRLPLMFAGFAVALAAIFFRGGPVLQDLAPIKTFQGVVVVVAIVLEIVCIRLTVGRWRQRTDNRLPLVILIVVGLHFVLMYPAMGPLIALIGAAGVVNASVGLIFARTPLRLLWFTDGVIKVAGGAVLLMLSPHWQAVV